jgi:hypothetical protein
VAAHHGGRQEEPLGLVPWLRAELGDEVEIVKPTPLELRLQVGAPLVERRIGCAVRDRGKVDDGEAALDRPIDAAKIIGRDEQELEDVSASPTPTPSVKESPEQTIRRLPPAASSTSLAPRKPREFVCKPMPVP